MPYTNRGKYLEHAWIYRGAPLPTNFYLALVTAAVIPGYATNTLGQLTQIATGNGYVDGGFSLARDTTDFDSHVENDTDNRSELQIKDVLTTAAGGPIPATGVGASYVVLTTDEALVANRQVIAWWNLGVSRDWLAGQVLRLADLELRSTNPS